VETSIIGEAQSGTTLRISNPEEWEEPCMHAGLVSIAMRGLSQEIMYVTCEDCETRKNELRQNEAR